MIFIYHYTELAGQYLDQISSTKYLSNYRLYNDKSETIDWFAYGAMAAGHVLCSSANFRQFLVV